MTRHNITGRYLFKRSGRKHHGFTLVELVVVLVIIAIIAAAGIFAAVGFISRSKFDQNSQNAITIYQTAQSALSEKNMNGTMDEWVRGIAVLKGTALFDPSLEAKLLDEKEANRSINKKTSLTYNPKSASNPEDKYLYDLLKGSFYDMTVFSGTMAVELDISATYGNGKINYSARVLSAFYSRENNISSGWDSVRKGIGYDPGDEEFKELPQAKGTEGYLYRRKTSYVGWFNGLSESVTAPMGLLPVFLPQSKVQPLEGHIVAGEQPGYLFNLRNGETLDVAWAIFDYDGTARKNHNEDIVITLNSAENGLDASAIRGNDTSDSKFHDGVQIHITPDALSSFLNSVETNPSTTVKESVNGIYDITRTSQEGFITAKVVRNENGTSKEYSSVNFPLTVTLVKGDGRKGTARDAEENLADYYEFRLSLDCMMDRADESANDPKWTHYGIDRLLGYTRESNINKLNPRNIYATLHGSWNSYKANGSTDYVTVNEAEPTEAARAMDDPIYLTNVRQTNGILTYIYFVEFNSGLGRYDEQDSMNNETNSVITGRCVVNSLFGDLNYSNSNDAADAEAVSGTFWGTNGGNAVLTSYRHLYNIRKVFDDKTATFRIVKNLDWYIHDTVVINGTETELYSSEVKVFKTGTAGYNSPVMGNLLKVVSFPALKELGAKKTLTSMSDTSKKTYWINNVQMRAASFQKNDAAYGLICSNMGTVYNIYTCNLNLVMKNVADGSASDYALINPDGDVSFDVSGARAYGNDIPIGGLIGKSNGKIGLEGIDSRNNTVQMCNCVVMSGDYWNAANHSRVAGLVGLCENSDADATDIYGVLELKGSFYILNGGARTGGLIADNNTNVAAKLIVDGSPVSQDNEFSKKPVETHSGKPVSCFIGGRGYIGAAFSWSDSRALTYGTAIDTDYISYNSETGKISFPDMEDNYQIDVNLPESSLLLQSQLFGSWSDPCGVGGAIGVAYRYNGDFLNIHVNNDGDILTLDGSSHKDGCGGAIGYLRDVPSAQNIFIVANNGSESHIGSPDENGPRYAGGAVGFVYGTLANCNFVLDVTNEGSINAVGNENYQGVGGAIGAAGEKYAGRSLISVENEYGSKIKWQGSDSGNGYGAGGAIGSLGKINENSADVSETNKITSDSVIYVSNEGLISGVSNVGGAIGFAPRNDGRIYAENSGQIQGLGGTGFVGGSVGRIIYRQCGLIQSVLDGATIVGTDFVGGAVGKINNFRNDAGEGVIVRSVVDGSSEVSSEYGSAVGGVAGDIYVQGNGSSGSIELSGHTSVPTLRVYGADAVGGVIGSYRSSNGNYSSVKTPDQSVTDRLIIDVEGSDYIGGVIGLLRNSTYYNNSLSDVLNSNLCVADIKITVNVILHPQSKIIGSGDDVGGAIGFVCSAAAAKNSQNSKFKGLISVRSFAGDNSGGSIIKGSSNVGGAIGRDNLSCPYIALGSSDDFGIFVDFSSSPWTIESTASSDVEANVGGAVGYFNDNSKGDETTTYITNIRFYSKTGLNERESGFKNNIFPITVDLGSSSVIADGRNVGGAIGKNLIRNGNITISDFSGTISGKNNVGGAIGLNRSDVNRIEVTMSGTIIGGNSSDINYDDLASPIDYDGSNVGGAVGYNISRINQGITVDNSGTIEGYGRNVGGAIGFCHFSEGNMFIEDIYVKLLGASRIIGHSRNVGGALGYTLGNIHTVTTEIRGTSRVIGDMSVGGVVGFASAQVNADNLAGTTGDNVKKNKVGYIDTAIAIISADNAIEGTKLIGGVIGETGFKRFMRYNGANRNAYTAPYFGEVKAVINSASVFSPDTGTDADDDAMAGGIIGHLTDGMVDNVVLGGTGGVVHVDYPNRSFSNSVLVRANGRAVGGLVGQIGYDGLQQNVFLSKVTIEDKAPYLCVVSGNGSDMIGGWIGSGNGAGGGIGKRNNVPHYNDTARSSYEVNNVKVVYSEGSYVGGLCGRMDLMNKNENNGSGARYINADVTVDLNGAYILGKSAVGAVAGGLGYGKWETGFITVNLSNYTNIGDIKNNIPSDTTEYDPICYEAGGAFGSVYFTNFGYTNTTTTFSVPITVNLDSTSRVSGLSGSDADTNAGVGVGGAFGTFMGCFDSKSKVIVNTTDNTDISVYSQNTNAGGVVGVWKDGKAGDKENQISFVSNISVEATGPNAYAGGFAGRILATGNLSGVQVFGNVNAGGNNSMAGGFVGNHKAGTIKWCFTTSIVSNPSGYSTGGFVGTANGGSFSNCYVGGHTYDGHYVAGESNITGKNNVGGFVGESTGTATFSQCYSTASVLGTGRNIGGYIGSMANSGKISDSYCTGRVINSSGDYSSTGAFAGSVAVVNNDRFPENSAKALVFVNDPTLRLVGSVGGNAPDESTYNKRIRYTDYNGINVSNNTYTGYPFDKGLLNPDTPDVTTAVYPLRAFINSTHYGDWPLASSGGISLDSSSITVDLSVLSVEYKKSGNELPRDSITVTYVNPDTLQPLKLDEGTHYSLKFTDNKKVGTAKVYISAIDGSGFTGSIVKNYSITPANISSATVVLNKNEYQYTGAPIEPANNELAVTLVRDDGTTEVLKKNTDFFITYSQNAETEDGEHTKIGTVYGKINGTNNYTGTAASGFTFKIIGTDISDADVSLIPNTATYTGEPIIPTVVVRVEGKQLKQAVDNDPGKEGDYVLEYENNIDVGTNTAKVKITGINNYGGTLEMTFSITPAVDSWITEPSISDWTYGSPNDPVGEAKSGYQIIYKYYLDSTLHTPTTPENSGAAEEGGKPVNVGKYYVQATVERIPNGNSEEGGVQYYNYTELAPVVKSFTISKADISEATVTFGSSPYHGHVDEYVKPEDITVSLNGTVLVKDRDYELTYPESTPEPGMYSVTITGIGNYEGTINDAQYEVVRYYYVDFVTGVDDIEIERQDIEAGEKATEPANPRTGYTLAWYSDSGCEEEDLYDFDAPVEKDTTLYAKWTQDENTDPDNGNDDPDDQNDPDNGSGDPNDQTDPDNGYVDPNDQNNPDNGYVDPNDPDNGNGDQNDQNDQDTGDEVTDDQNDQDSGDEDTDDQNDQDSGDEDPDGQNDQDTGDEDTDGQNDQDTGDEDTDGQNDQDGGNEDPDGQNDQDSGDEDPDGQNDKDTGDEDTDDQNDQDTGDEDTDDQNDQDSGDEDPDGQNDQDTGDEDTDDQNDQDSGDEDPDGQNDQDSGDEDTDGQYDQDSGDEDSDGQNDQNTGGGDPIDQNDQNTGGGDPIDQNGQDTGGDGPNDQNGSDSGNGNPNNQTDPDTG